MLIIYCHGFINVIYLLCKRLKVSPLNSITIYGTYNIDIITSLICMIIDLLLFSNNWS